MSIVRTISRAVLPPAICVLFTLPVSACREAHDDPLAVAVAPETHGALGFPRELASVPHLLDHQGLKEEGAAEAGAWWASWDLSPEEGDRLRSRIYPSVARRILPGLGDEGLLRILVGNEERLDAVENLGTLFPPRHPAREAAGRARELHRSAVDARERGDPEEALERLLQSVDALWRVRPEEVAEDLLIRAEEARRRIEGASTYSQEELTRIRRLTAGAREALEAGDYPQSIRRAYYACQLLGADPS